MATKTKGHSAKVAITLLSDGQRLPVAQVGNNGLLVRNLPQPIPPGTATLVIQIDDTTKKYRIVLPQGVQEPGTFVSFF